jgi:hypothetical protein
MKKKTYHWLKPFASILPPSEKKCIRKLQINVKKHHASKQLNNSKLIKLTTPIN